MKLIPKLVPGTSVVMFVEADDEDNPIEDKPKRKRGRPRKKPKPEELRETRAFDGMGAVVS